MRLVVVMREKRDYSREVYMWLGDWDRRNPGLQPEIIDPDSRDGVGFITAYDLLEFPAVIVLRDDGSVVHMWKGTPMPGLDEVRGHLVR